MSETEARVHELPPCDLCKVFRGIIVIAVYDGATTRGAWAYMCQEHFDDWGVGLGLGRGQRLVLIRPDCDWCGEELKEEQAEIARGDERKVVCAEPCAAELTHPTRGWQIA